MAKKKEAPVKGTKMTEEEKAAKKKARLEAIKNRPAGQRPNSKQIDVIQVSENSVVENYGYPVKNKEGHQGVLVTSIVKEDGKIVSTSVTFVPGNLTIKAKKGHGVITSPKSKKNSSEEEDNEEED